MSSAIQTFKSKIMPIFFFGLAIYTLFTLTKNLIEVTRKKLKLDVNPPSSRCVPFFDTVLEKEKIWNPDPDNKTTLLLYDYMAGEAIVRACTNLTNTTIINDLGAENMYTPFAQEGCPIDGPNSWGPKIKNENWCKIYNAPYANTTCADVLNWSPCPKGCTEPPCCQGWGFAWDIQVMDGNFTNTTTGKNQPYPKCFQRFEKLDGLPTCYGKWVGIFHTKSKDLEAFMYFAVFVPVAVFLAQLAMLNKFDPAPPFDDDYYVSFAMRGIPGPIYQFWWIYIAKRGRFPVAKLKLWTWLLCLTQDIVEGIISPAVAMSGCNLSRFPVPLALLILKLIKILVDAFMYFKDDGSNDVTPDIPDPSKQIEPDQQTAYQQMPVNNGMVYQQQPFAPPPQQAYYTTPQGGTQYTSTTEV